MSESFARPALTIQSHKGPYEVIFDEVDFARFTHEGPSNVHYLIDARIADLYSRELSGLLEASSVLRIPATEANKSLDKFEGYVDHLLSRKIRRGHVLMAVGGGILQDIACFLAATLFRGLEWYFFPTTLLAQADSCIGSKSSINVGETKNVMGTFTPPTKVVINMRFLDTLEDRDMRSGIGEMLKVHAIEGPVSFDRLAAEYPLLLKDRVVLGDAIRRSLEIKKRIIEQDEFDKGIRTVMNYGHSFGHAIESATGFYVPHGIAVTLGMDLANHLSVRTGWMRKSHYDRMHSVLSLNYAGFERTEIPLDAFLSAIAKDKKNIDDNLSLIVPDAEARIGKRSFPNDGVFREICANYFMWERYR